MDKENKNDKFNKLNVAFMPLVYVCNWQDKTMQAMKEIGQIEFNYLIDIALRDEPDIRYDKIIIPFYDEHTKSHAVRMLFKRDDLIVDNSLEITAGRCLVLRWIDDKKTECLQEKNNPTESRRRVDISICELRDTNDICEVLSAMKYNKVSIHSLFLSISGIPSINTLFLETMFNNADVDPYLRSFSYLQGKGFMIKSCGTCWPS